MKKSVFAFACLILAVLASSCGSVTTKIGQNGEEFEALETSGSMPAKDVYPSLLVPAARGLTEVERNRALQAAYVKQAEAIQKGDRKAAEEWQLTINKLLPKPQAVTPTSVRQPRPIYSYNAKSNDQNDKVEEIRSVTVTNPTAHRAELTKLGIEIAPGQSLSIEVSEKSLVYKLTSKKGQVWTRTKPVADKIILSL